MTSVCFSHHSRSILSVCLSPFHAVSGWRFCWVVKLSPTLLSTAWDKRKNKRQDEERRQYLCLLINGALLWAIPYLMNAGMHTGRRSTEKHRKTHLCIHMHRDTDDLAVNRHVWISPLCVGWMKGNIYQKLNLTSSSLLCIEILNRNKHAFSTLIITE